MSRIVCVIALMMAAVVGPASACTCLPRTVEQKFCNDEFAGVFLIKDYGTVIGGQFGVRRYKADLIYMYRTVFGPRAEPGYLYTPVDSAACGVRLEKGHYYVVSGSYQPFGHPIYSRMTTNLCELQIKFPYNPIYTFDRPDCEESTHRQISYGRK